MDSKEKFIRLQSDLADKKTYTEDELEDLSTFWAESMSEGKFPDYVRSLNAGLDFKMGFIIFHKILTGRK